MTPRLCCLGILRYFTLERLEGGLCNRDQSWEDRNSGRGLLAFKELLHDQLNLSLNFSMTNINGTRKEITLRLILVVRFWETAARESYYCTKEFLCTHLWGKSHWAWEFWSESFQKWDDPAGAFYCTGGMESSLCIKYVSLKEKAG